MIRNATQEDINQIRKLWDRCFHDPLDYVDFIYDHIADVSGTLVLEEKRRIVAMLTVIPTAFKFRDKSIKAAYFYGAATEKNFRKKGYMTMLLDYAEKRCREDKFALSVLVPGESVLFEYYANRGYSTDFYLRTVHIGIGMLDASLKLDSEIVYDKPDFKKIYRLREKALSDIPHIAWDQKQVATVVNDCILYGANTAYYGGGYGEAYAIYDVQRGRMFVKECFGTSEEAELLLLKEIIVTHNPRSVTVQLPVTSGLFKFEGELARYGMAKPLNIESGIRDMDPYMNLMLD